MYNKFTLLLLPIIISGCMSLDPEYTRPTESVPQTLPSGGSVYPVLNNSAEYNISWNNYIQNEKLKKVISISLNNNKDLKIALANIEAARAQYGITQSATLPTLNGGLSANKGRTLAGETEGYEANVGLSAYELDFFGRVRSLSTSSLETFLSTNEAKRVTQLSIISETSKAYFLLALNKSKLEIAQRTVDDSKESLDLIKARVENGIDSDLDLSSAQTVYYRAKADIDNFNTLIEQNKNALNLISGTTINPELLPNNLNDLTNSIKAPQIGISSDVLLNRPDIIMAEHQLKAANANIGAARAAFFPRISLTASGGIASNDLSSLFKNGHGVWSFAPNISIPIFDNGYNTSNLNYTKAEKERYVLLYEKSIQTAFSEVSDALARKGTIKSQLNYFNSLVEESTRSFKLSQISYNEGVYNYLDVLTAQRNLYLVQKEYLDIQIEEYNNLIDLYKVSGIGI